MAQRDDDYLPNVPLLTGWRHDGDPLSLLEQSLAQGINEAFIGRHSPREVFDQLFQELDVVGPSR